MYDAYTPDKLVYDPCTGILRTVSTKLVWATLKSAKRRQAGTRRSSRQMQGAIADDAQAC